MEREERILGEFEFSVVVNGKIHKPAMQYYKACCRVAKDEGKKMWSPKDWGTFCTAMWHITTDDYFKLVGELPDFLILTYEPIDGATIFRLVADRKDVATYEIDTSRGLKITRTMAVIGTKAINQNTIIVERIQTGA